MAALQDMTSKAPWSEEGMRRHFVFIGKISPLFRKKRMAQFIRLFQPTPHTRILDVGGLPRFWAESGLEAHITIVNLTPLDEFEASFLTSRQEFCQGDATCLPWEDRSFDIVFSNSLIEHLGTLTNQKAFASECRRVGKSYWVQTPAWEFPIEPHFLGLGVHWFPKRVRGSIVRWCTPWGLMARPRQDVLDNEMEELRLLSCSEFRSLFPDSRILKERALGLPKSYVALKLPPAGHLN